MTEYTSPLLFMETCSLEKWKKKDVMMPSLFGNFWQHQEFSVQQPHYQEMETYWWSVFNNEGPQGPGETQTQQDVEDVAAYGVGHRHVSHTWRKTGDVSFRTEAFSNLAQVSALKSCPSILPTSNGKQFQSVLYAVSFFLGLKYWTNCKPSLAYAVAILSQLEGIFTLKE